MSGALRLATLFLLLTFAPAVALADPPAAYQGDPAHTGFAAGTSFAPPLGKRWVRRDLGTNVTYPLFADGKVFVSGSNGLFALDPATGRTLWSRNVTAYGIAYDAGRLFVTTSGGVVQALSATNGASIWVTTVPGQSTVLWGPTPYGGDIVYATSRSQLFGIRESDGLVLMSSSLDQADQSVPAVDADRVYAVDYCNAHAFQRTVGVELWKTPVPSCTTRGDAPVLYGGRLYAASSGSVFDAGNGKLVDTFSALWPPAIANGIAYFAQQRTMSARSLTSGVSLWQVETPGHSVSPPLVAGGYVYDLDSEGNVIALDRSSGQLVWQENIGTDLGDPHPVASQGLAGAGDTLVATANTQSVGEAGFVLGFSPGADTPGVGLPPLPPAPVTLRVGRQQLTYGDHLGTGLVGKVGVEDEVPVDIYASRFPYTSSARVATVETRYGGDFTYGIQPDRNTVYWATYNGSSSARVPVFLSLKYVPLIQAGRHPHWVSVLVVGPPAVPLGGRRVHQYMYRARRRAAYRIASGRLRVLKGHWRGTKAKVKMRIHPPRKRRGDYYFVCLEEKRDDGFGKPDPADSECGHKVLR